MSTSEQYVRDLEEMVGTNGWRRLVKDAEEAIRDREKAALQATSIEEVYYLRGEAAQLAILATLELQLDMLKANESDVEEI